MHLPIYGLPLWVPRESERNSMPKSNSGVSAVACAASSSAVPPGQRGEQFGGGDAQPGSKPPDHVQSWRAEAAFTARNVNPVEACPLRTPRRSMDRCRVGRASTRQANPSPRLWRHETGGSGQADAHPAGSAGRHRVASCEANGWRILDGMAGDDGKAAPSTAHVHRLRTTRPEARNPRARAITVACTVAAASAGDARGSSTQGTIARDNSRRSRRASGRFE